MPHLHPGYEYSADPGRIDLDAVWDLLAAHAYWGQWRTREILGAQIAGSWRVVGAYHRPSGELVGFVRAVSDGVSLGYVADVLVHPDHRGHRLGVGLVHTLIEDGPGAHFRWMLHTRDAHSLYAKFGFAAPDETFMERPGRAPQVPNARREPRSLSRTEQS
jgi:GNAT superfamily N-acetyltransferase